MSITAAAVVPASPALLSGMTGTARPAQHLREAALDAIANVLRTEPVAIVVIAQGPITDEFDAQCALGLSRLGGMPPADELGKGRALPIPLAIGASLLRDSGWGGTVTFRTIAEDCSLESIREVGRGLADDSRRIGLILLGNGSACSTAGAPGSLHPDAASFNADVDRVIDACDSAALARLTRPACAEQLSDAFIPLHVLDSALGSRITTIRLSEEFRGVHMVIATMLPTDHDDEKSSR